MFAHIYRSDRQKTWIPIFVGLGCDVTGEVDSLVDKKCDDGLQYISEGLDAFILRSNIKNYRERNRHLIFVVNYQYEQPWSKVNIPPATWYDEKFEIQCPVGRGAYQGI